jgi:hypothetical protein
MMKAKQNPKTRSGDTGEKRLSAWDNSGSLQSSTVDRWIIVACNLQEYFISFSGNISICSNTTVTLSLLVQLVANTDVQPVSRRIR